MLLNIEINTKLAITTEIIHGQLIHHRITRRPVDSQREDSLIVKLTWISNQHDHVNGFFLSCNSLYNSYIIIKPTGSLVVGWFHFLSYFREHEGSESVYKHEHVTEMGLRMTSTITACVIRWNLLVSLNNFRCFRRNSWIMKSTVKSMRKC